MRIVHVLAPAPVGGLESVVRLLAAGQRDRGHEVTIVVTTDVGDHPFVVAARDDGLEVREIRVGGRAYARERRLFGATVDSLRPHVVHSHGYRPDILHLAAARRRGAAAVTTLHGFTGGNWKMRLYQRMQLRAARHADAVIAVSGGVAALVAHAGTPPARIHLVRNAYASRDVRPARSEARARLGLSEGTLAIGWIGRLSTEKGPDVAVDAMAAMHDIPATLYFVGEGPDREALAARATAAGITDRVRFAGVVPQAATLIPAFDVLLLSSRTEGTPMVILEAMAAETPIVATAVGGVPDVLTEESAWLVPSENPSAIAAALRAALTDRREAATRAGRAATVLRDHFGVEQWLDRHDALYASIIR